MLNKNKIVNAVAKHVREKFDKEGTGHDWWHIERVWKTAKYIAKIEGGDHFIIELGALLHDIADWKFNKDHKAGSKAAKQLLAPYGIPVETAVAITYIIDNVRLSSVPTSTECKP